LTAGVYGAYHELDSKWIVVQVYDENDYQVIPDKLTVVDNNYLEVDLSTFAPISGSWHIVAISQSGVGSGSSGTSGVSGTSGTSGKTTGSFSSTFTDASLTAGVYGAYHGLDSKWIVVQVYDENDYQVIPDKLTVVDNNYLEVDLSTFAPISGSWHMVAISQSGVGSGSSGSSGSSGTSGTSGSSGTSGTSGTFDTTTNEITPNSTMAIDWNDGLTQYVTLTGVTGGTFTFNNPVSGQIYRLILIQSETGPNTITTWPTIKWAGGSAPTLSTVAGKTDIVTLLYVGTTYYGDCARNF